MILKKKLNVLNEASAIRNKSLKSDEIPLVLGKELPTKKDVDKNESPAKKEAKEKGNTPRQSTGRAGEKEKEAVVIMSPSTPSNIEGDMFLSVDARSRRRGSVSSRAGGSASSRKGGSASPQMSDVMESSKKSKKQEGKPVSFSLNFAEKADVAEGKFSFDGNDRDGRSSRSVSSVGEKEMSASVKKPKTSLLIMQNILMSS
jgi:hypothetical protein